MVPVKVPHMNIHGGLSAQTDRPSGSPTGGRVYCNVIMKALGIW